MRVYFYAIVAFFGYLGFLLFLLCCCTKDIVPIEPDEDDSEYWFDVCACTGTGWQWTGEDPEVTEERNRLEEQ